MITIDMIGRIRRLHRRTKKSVREIARIMRVSRNTISKWLHDCVSPGEPTKKRAQR